MPLEPKPGDPFGVGGLTQREIDNVLRLPAGAAPEVQVYMRRLSDIAQESIKWLWPGRIPRGKVTLIVGDPGLGKTTAAIDIAARVTAGRPMPGEYEAAAPADVLIASAEDDPADTIRPRFEAAGGDLTRVHVLGNAFQRDNQDYGLTLADVDVLTAALDRATNPAMMLIDPVSAYLGNTDSHNNSAMRGLLTPLADLASQWRVAVVGITHPSKATGTSALNRVIGSIGFVAAARAAHFVCRDADIEDRRLFLPLKNNLGPDRGGLAFKIDGSGAAPRVVWEDGAVYLTPDEALAAGSEERGTKEAGAAAWLFPRLAAGPVAVALLQAEAAAKDFSWRTVERAKGKLGVKVERVGGVGDAGSWRWSLA